MSIANWSRSPPLVHIRPRKVVPRPDPPGVGTEALDGACNEQVPDEGGYNGRDGGEGGRSNHASGQRGEEIAGFRAERFRKFNLTFKAIPHLYRHPGNQRASVVGDFQLLASPRCMAAANSDCPSVGNSGTALTHRI